MSVNFYGEFASNPGVTENIQFFGSEVGVGEFEPGTHEIDVDLTGGGLLVGTSTVKGLNEFIADGLTFSASRFISTRVSASTIRILRGPFTLTTFVPAGTWKGSKATTTETTSSTPPTTPYGGMHFQVEALVNDDDGIADEGDYTYWKNHFGETGGGGSAGLGVAVPEPSSLLLVILGGCCFRRLRIRR